MVIYNFMNIFGTGVSNFCGISIKNFTYNVVPLEVLI